MPRLGGDTVYQYQLQSLPLLRATLAHCLVYVGNDGGPKHIAAAAGCPTVTVYGTTHPAHWNPAGAPEHRAVCSRHRELHQVYGTQTTANALEEIPINAVLAEIPLAISTGMRKAA